jgi:Putative Ig domain
MPGPYTTFEYGDPAAVTGYPANPYFDGPLNFVCGIYVTGSSGGGASIPVIWGEQLGSGTVGVAYSESLTASGGTGGYNFSIASGSLPPGLSLSSGGVISGTPTTAGTYTFGVEATDSSGNSNTETFQIVVTAPANYGFVG